MWLNLISNLIDSIYDKIKPGTKSKMSIIIVKFKSVNILIKNADNKQILIQTKDLVFGDIIISPQFLLLNYHKILLYH